MMVNIFINPEADFICFTLFVSYLNNYIERSSLSKMS